MLESSLEDQMVPSMTVEEVSTKEVKRRGKVLIDNLTNPFFPQRTPMALNDVVSEESLNAFVVRPLMKSAARITFVQSRLSFYFL